MNYYLPTIQADFKGMSDLALLASLSNAVRHKDIELDFSNVRFFAANMTSPFGAVLAHMGQFQNVTFNAIPRTIETILRRNRFLTYFRGESLPDQFRSTIPYQEFTIHDEDHFNEYIDTQLDRPELSAFSINTGHVLERTAFEVFHNAVQHSESSLGIFVCGQFFPRNECLLFSITDAGVGIPGRVRKFFRRDDISSIQALQWALEISHTTKSQSHPGGLGLPEIHNTISRNGGAIMIASDTAYFEYKDGVEKFKTIKSNFPGTSVTVAIKTDRDWMSDLDDEGGIPF